MTLDLTELSAFAEELADRASQRLVAWFGRVQPHIKGDGSLVTQADEEVDRLIHMAVQDRYAQHGVLSEELSLVYQGAEYTWVVDPLDGTTNFANGLQYWGTSIALLYLGRPVLGVLDFPLLGQRYFARDGDGAWLNGKKLRVVASREVHENQFYFTDARGCRHLEFRIPPKPRVLGSAAYDLAGVAAGTAVACLEILPKVWDLAAAWVINQEAGAIVAPLLEGSTLFPLQPGTDYAERVYPVLAAASTEIWQLVRDNISLKPGRKRLAERLAAQGWVLDPIL
jgi:myo-inositol-1(or 4)-monophosphatase